MYKIIKSFQSNNSLLDDFVIYDSPEKEKKNRFEKSFNIYRNKNENYQSPDLELENSLSKVSYPQDNIGYIKNLLLENYSHCDNAQVFMISDNNAKKIFVIEYRLSIELNSKFYNVYILVYLPLLFPKHPPEFYIEKTANVGLNKFYLDGKINPEDFRINLDNFVKFDPCQNNVGEIIDNLIINFRDKFPVYKRFNENDDSWRTGKCYLDKYKAIRIKLPKDPKNYKFGSNTYFIPKSEKRNNNDLETRLNDEIFKNKKLEEENNKLKKSLNLKIYEINKLTNDWILIKLENDTLKSELLKVKKIITGNNQIQNNELEKIKDENIILKSKLDLKDKEIQNLQIKIQNSIIEVPKYELNDIIVLTFISAEVNYGIKCLASDTFAEVEEKLYKKYDYLRNTNNTFIVNAKPILRFKKISENNIKDGDLIQLFQLK